MLSELNHLTTGRLATQNACRKPDLDYAGVRNWQRGDLAMQLQSGDCYVLWSDQIVRLRDRLDENRWMAVIWDRLACDWSLSVYAIDEHLIDRIVHDPASMQQRSIG